jgi:hypothetical protein
MAPDLLHLEAVELHHHVRGEAAEGEAEGRVRLGHGEVGEVHLDQSETSMDQKTLPWARFMASGLW